MAFTSDVLVERTAPGQRQTVKEQGMLHVTEQLIPILLMISSISGIQYINDLVHNINI